jgi:hypothetical protein
VAENEAEMNILLEQGLLAALQRQYARNSRWSEISFRVAPIQGLAGVQVQQAGRLDCVLVELETLYREHVKKGLNTITVANIFNSPLSEAFIFTLFEPINRAVRSLHGCSLRSCTGVLYDLYLVRTLLAKGQMPQYEERKHGRIDLVYQDGSPANAYDANEDVRASFIAPYLLSTETGSHGWMVPDLKKDCCRQIFRRDIADGVLALDSLKPCLPSVEAAE